MDARVLRDLCKHMVCTLVFKACYNSWVPQAPAPGDQSPLIQIQNISCLFCFFLPDPNPIDQIQTLSHLLVARRASSCITPSSTRATFRSPAGEGRAAGGSESRPRKGVLQADAQRELSKMRSPLSFPVRLLCFLAQTQSSKASSKELVACLFRPCFVFVCGWFVFVCLFVCFVRLFFD